VKIWWAILAKDHEKLQRQASFRRWYRCSHFRFRHSASWSEDIARVPLYTFSLSRSRHAAGANWECDSSPRDRGRIEIEGCRCLYGTISAFGIFRHWRQCVFLRFGGNRWCNCCSILSRFFVEIKTIFFALSIMLYFHDLLIIRDNKIDNMGPII